MSARVFRIRARLRLSSWMTARASMRREQARARLRVWQRAVNVRERTPPRTRADTVCDYWFNGGAASRHQVAKARSAAGWAWRTSTLTPTGSWMVSI